MEFEWYNAKTLAYLAEGVGITSVGVGGGIADSETILLGAGIFIFGRIYGAMLNDYRTNSEKESLLEQFATGQ